nr:inactive polyglycylase TTLL10 isoform X9 [Pongo pygmaeus]
MFKSLFCSSYQGAVSCRSFHLTSWHPGRAQPRLRSSSGWGGRARQRQGAETALPPHGARPHSCHGDGSQPHAQAQAHGPGRRPFLGRVDLTASSIQVLGPRAARSSHRRVRVASSLQGPRPGTPRPMAHSCTRFIHRRGPPTRTQAGSKRGKRPRIQRRPRAQVSGPAHKRPMGSSQEEGLPCQPSQPDHDAGGHCGPDLEGTERASATPGPPGLLNSHPPADSDDTNATRPSAALLEGLLLGGGKPSPHSTRPGPFFYIGGSNGATIISSYCKSKGWQRIQDSRRDDYTLKWCEVKSRDNYGSFREGEQLLYQLPNNKLLTTKIGLLSTLRGRARAMSQASKVLGGAQARLEKDTAAPALEDLPWTSPGYLRPQRVLRMEEFFPETYRLDLKHEREAFFTLFDETQIWICKPTASNQGKGIFLLRNQEEVAALQAKTRSMEDDPIHHKTPFRGPQARVVQRWPGLGGLPAAGPPTPRPSCSLQADGQADHSFPEWEGFLQKALWLHEAEGLDLSTSPPALLEPHSGHSCHPPSPASIGSSLASLHLACSPPGAPPLPAVLPLPSAPHRCPPGALLPFLSKATSCPPPPPGSPPGSYCGYVLGHP